MGFGKTPENLDAFYSRSDKDYSFTPRIVVRGVPVDILVGNVGSELFGFAVGEDGTIYFKVNVLPSIGRTDESNSINWRARLAMAERLIVQLNR